MANLYVTRITKYHLRGKVVHCGCEPAWRSVHRLAGYSPGSVKTCTVRSTEIGHGDGNEDARDARALLHGD